MAWIRIVLIACVFPLMSHTLNISATDACHKLDMVFCNVSRKCIHKDWICDGDNDCRNGEDEAASACSKSSLSNIMS
ncbi:hypothetical protein MAR_028118 [Mya arenaria]|uniref:Uncharacterized protein n=1 Tax=Mya arenaria TaxID=6604 RepID=A0ABY7DH63_MYAAR|nr:hypothetical protein MAR_028118 [Mya arenaria]